jgi:hypothetical protein
MMKEKILVSVSSSDPRPDSTLYTLDPAGTEQAELFSFHDHPQHKAGSIWQPRIAPDGGTIYFSSDHAYAYTPARCNLFRIGADGSWQEQITPGPNSGRWDQPGPFGTVKGAVRKSNGDPWGNSPIYLEGVGIQYSQPDGSFRFEQVPEGERWVVAYRPGDANYSDALPVSVVAGATCGGLHLVPDHGSKMNFEYPIPHGKRIYHRFVNDRVRWIDLGLSGYNDVHTVSADLCNSIPQVDGFDLAPSSGRLALVDYAEGCPGHQGLYVAGRDGKDLEVLVDGKAIPAWCGAQEVFWSPDESRIALKVCYNWQCCLMVLDLSRGQLTGWVCFDSRYTLGNVALHGWSPDGGWLLFSYWLDRQSEGVLAKIKVSADGSLDMSSVVNLLSGVHISGATWGSLAT